MTEKEGIVIAEFEDTLNALLSNPEAMNQIMSLAKSINGENSNQDSPPPSHEDHSSTEESTSIPPQLGDLLSSFSGGIDPGMLKIITKIMQEYGSTQDNKNMALLSALRPFLKEKRQAKIDQAIQIAKISRIARAAFRTMKGGEDPV